MPASPIQVRVLGPHLHLFGPVSEPAGAAGCEPQKGKTGCRRPLSHRARVRDDQPVAAIAGQETQVLKPDRRRLAPHIEAPPAPAHHLACPCEGVGHLRSVQAMPRLHIDHHRAGIRHQQIVRNVSSGRRADLRAEQERLRHDPRNRRIEVGCQQHRQLQPGLVNHMISLSTRPEGARVMPLAQVPAKRPPRHRRYQSLQRHGVPRTTLDGAAIRTAHVHHHGPYRDLSSHRRPPDLGPTYERDRLNATATATILVGSAQRRVTK
jgi:hypothetical protein